MRDEDQDSKSGEKIISAGSEVIGSLGGAGLGLVIAGPPGALIGAAAGPIGSAILKQAANVARRRLTRREERRAGSVLAIAASELKLKVDAGDTIRSDEFFDLGDDERSAAEEVIEAVVRAAESDPEERKLPYVGFLFANIALTSEVSRETANRLISLARSLTYSELRFLALFHAAHDKAEEIGLSDELPAGATNYSLPESSSVAEILDPIWSLYSQHLILGRGRSLGLGGLKPRDLRSFGAGRQLADLMELNRMPFSEIKEIAASIPRK